MPTTQTTTKPKLSTSTSKSSTGSNQSSHAPVLRHHAGPDLLATGPKFRATKINFPVRKRKLDPEERKKLAQARWRKAIRRVRAMLRFQVQVSVMEEEQKEPVRYAPTYRMDPDPGKRFNASLVQEIIQNVLRDRLQEYEYSRFTAPKFAKVLSGVLNEKIKELDFPRYRFVTNVIIVENKQQGVSFASRCVWDPKIDAYATGQYKRETFIAVASIHGVYFE